MDLMQHQAFYNHLLLVDPTDATRNTIYLGGELSAAKSTDGGSTWIPISNWLAQFGLPYLHADFHTAAFTNLALTKTLFFGNDGGLFISTDGGATWSDRTNIGLVDSLHFSLSSNPTQPNSTITGLQDLGTRVREGGTSIFDQTLGGDGFGAGTSQANSLITLGTVYNDDIYESGDLGLTFNSANNGINTNDAGFFTELTTPAVTADPTGKVFFTTGNHDIYKTTDGATTW